MQYVVQQIAPRLPIRLKSLYDRYQISQTSVTLHLCSNVPMTRGCLQLIPWTMCDLAGKLSK